MHLHGTSKVFTWTYIHMWVYPTSINIYWMKDRGKESEMIYRTIINLN